MEIESDAVDINIEDDIQIIHTSFKEETKNQNAKHNSPKSIKLSHSDNKSNFNDDISEHSRKSHEDRKNSETMDISMEKDDEDSSSADLNKIHKRHITKKKSNRLDKTNSMLYTKEPNFVHTNNQIIKFEDELQITDDDEEAHLAAANNKTICDTTLIKLKKIKHEPKTRFSEIDVVDLSDNEDGVFPYSQLFDIKFEDNTENKQVNIKQEYVGNDSEKAGLLDVDDEVIILTDSEDEDNPWLHRLSRSQIINEDKEPDANDAIIKNEVDFGIWDDDDDITNIIQSKVPCTSKNIDEVIDERSVDVGSEVPNIASEVPAYKKTSLEPSVNISDRTDGEDNNSNTNLLATKADAMDVDDISPSKASTSKNINHTTRQETDVKQDTKPDEQTEASNNALPLTSEKLKLTVIKSSSKATVKRLIPIIEAPHLPVKRSRANKDNDKASKSIEKKSLQKLKPQENKMLKLKNKLSDNFYFKEQEQREHRKETETADCPQPSKTSISKGTSISKEEKKIIVEERKMKLKKLAEEEKKLSINQTVKRRIAKPKAKVSLKNRGDFLINEQETHVSKSANASANTSAEQAKSGSVQSKKRTTDKADTSKDSATSNTGTKKLPPEKNLSKDSTVTVNNISVSLQQSLSLNSTSNTIKIPKKAPDSTKNSNMIDDTKKEIIREDTQRKKRSSSQGRKKSDKSAIDVGSKTNYELQKKPSERTSALVQTNNSLPDAIKPTLVMKPKTKKRVNFSENVQIIEYEIDVNNSLKKLVGKDAPIPDNKLAKTTCAGWSPKLEEFLLYIFMWNPVWLEEQRYLKTEPPIVSESELQPMKMRYDSFEQYYKIAQPLLLLEIWHTITKDFEMVEKNKQRATMMCSIVANSTTHTPIPSTNLFLTTLMFEVLVRKEDLAMRTHPNYGDLVSFEYIKNICGKQTFHKVFAYITDMYQVVITNFTHYNRDLRNYVKNPYAVITYTMLTRPLEQDILVNKVQRVRTVMYLRANMRMVQALQYLPQSPLLNLILNPKVEDYQLPLMTNKSQKYSSLVTKDKLNPKQLEAVFRVTETVLKNEAKLCFIQGPPGTGKSKVIVNLVTQILYGESEHRNTEKVLRILICAPSNAAIDEIVTRLLAIRSNLKQKRFNMVRIGRPETMHPLAKDISVTVLAKRYLKRVADKGAHSPLSSNGAASFKEEKAMLEARMDSLRNELNNSRNMLDVRRKELKRRINDTSMRYAILTYGKSIDEFSHKDRVKYQRIAEDTILAGADIIACTLSSCYTNQMESIFGTNKQRLSVCIVDEATQSCEAETLIPLMLGVNNLVLVGDPNQLPATIISQRAKKLGLDQSVFSRIQSVFASETNSPIIMLDMQYRMAYNISYWPNRYFYGGKLKNAVETRLTFPFHAYRVLNHCFAQNDDKFSNTTEAEFVANMIFAMLKFAKWENTSSCISLGVLTPYNNQRTVVLNKINEKSVAREQLHLRQL